MPTPLHARAEPTGGRLIWQIFFCLVEAFLTVSWDLILSPFAKKKKADRQWVRRDRIAIVHTLPRETFNEVLHLIHGTLVRTLAMSRPVRSIKNGYVPDIAVHPF